MRMRRRKRTTRSKQYPRVPHLRLIKAMIVLVSIFPVTVLFSTVPCVCNVWVCLFNGSFLDFIF